MKVDDRSATERWAARIAVGFLVIACALYVVSQVASDDWVFGSFAACLVSASAIALALILQGRRDR